MALSTAKKSAIVQLCNCISSSSCSISNLKQLSDGEFFVNTISSVFPEFLKDTEKSENEAINDDKDINVIPTTDTPETEHTNPQNDKNVVESFEPPGDKNILQRFTFVQKFIDDHYVLKSEEIISYNQCVESNELELAKVAIFVLSEVVKHFVHIKNDHLQTLSHLDIKVQEDLEECFNYFITERFKISKSETEKILRHPAKYKVSRSPDRSAFATPHRACSSKYKRSLSTSTPSNEDMFTNSPLKSFFESPIFKKEDIFVKNKELEKVRKALYEEELKCEDLQSELKEVKKGLNLKDKEIRKLKQDVARLNESYQKLLSSECTNKKCKQKFEKEQSQYKKQRDFLYSEITNLNMKVSKLEKLQSPGSGSSKGDRRRSISSVDKLVEIKLNAKDAQINSLSEEVSRLKQQLGDTLKDFSAYKSMSREKNSSLKEEPLTPVVNENIGNIIEEDNRKLQAELKEARLQINRLIEENMKLKERVQNEELQSSFRNNSDNPSMPKFDLYDLAEKEKLRSEKCSESVNELTSLSIEHSPFNSSVTRQPSTSIMWEGDPPAENISAVLWRRYHSESELENNVSTDCIDIENDLSMGRDASVAKCDDVGSHSNVPGSSQETCVQESTSKTDGANVKHNSVLEQVIHIILNCFTGMPANGSYKYAIKDLKKLKTECAMLRTSPNGSNGHDPRVLLIKMLDSLISAIHQEEGTRRVSGTSYSESRAETKEINELKCQLTEKSSLLKEKEDELNKLKSEYNSLEGKYQTTIQEKDAIQKTNEDCQEKSKRLKQRYKEVINEIKSKLTQSTNKYNILEKDYSSLKKKHQLLVEKYEIKNYELLSFARKDAQLVTLGSRLAQKESEIKGFQEKLTIYKSKNIELKERIRGFQLAESDLKIMVKNLKKKLEKNESYSTVLLRSLNNFMKNRGSSTPQTDQQIPQTDQQIEEPSSSSLSVLPEYPVTSFDGSNASVLSGALYRKSKTPFLLENQDEEDFLNHSSICSMNEKREEDRLEELKRRNSILPIHLQSVYPTEANLPLPCDDLYVRNPQKNSSNHQVTASGANSKKRKLDDTKFDNQKIQSEVSFKTPIQIKRYSVRTPTSMKKLFQFKRRNNRPGFVKPKP